MDNAGQMKGLIAGAGCSVINFPKEMFPMAEGFSDVAQAPHARVMLLKNELSIAIVVMELVNTPSFIIDSIRTVINEKTGTPKSNVWVSSTHAFCTPHVPLDGTNLVRFSEAVMTAAEEAIDRAIADLQSARIGIGSGRCSVNVNNEAFVGGKWIDTVPNPVRPSDKTLTVIKVEGYRGNNIGMMFSYGVRSGCADAPRGMETGRLITPDLTGEACLMIEDEIKAPVLYLNSAAADQMPREAALYFKVSEDGNSAARIWDNENGINNGIEISKIMGRELAVSVLEIAAGITAAGPGVLAHARSSYEWENKTGDAKIRIPVEVMTIDDLAMAAVKTEISAQTSLAFREGLKQFGHAVILTFVNGDQSYMPAAAAYDEGTRASQKSSLKRGAAEEFLKVATDMLAGDLEKTDEDSLAFEEAGKTVFEGTDADCVGTVITLGGISWKVLALKEDKMLIVSENVILTGPFNEAGGKVLWEDSSVRAYLNGRFLDRFNDAERDRITETVNANKANETYVTGSGPDTVDKVFLLSEEEANGYFASDRDRVACDRETGVPQTWWLRTSGKDTAYAATVLSNGSIYPHGNRAGETKDSTPGDKYEPSSVRPAMWITV